LGDAKAGCGARVDGHEGSFVKVCREADSEAKLVKDAFEFGRGMAGSMWNDSGVISILAHIRGSIIVDRVAELVERERLDD
jgi:hypothetical protein